ncbi:MAG: uL30 family ribosomal protein [Candidatus Woesearchaeota archaeon]|nr:uL30 family ribosomal protein [Candidatus Woesearchaeota archaeon]
MAKIAVIKIRGTVSARGDAIDTLRMLNLKRKNVMVLLEKNDNTLGMLARVKDYVAYGDIDESFEKTLKEKRPIEYEKGFFRLHPPKGGFESKGIKKPYSIGGALGYRKSEIAALIKKMM